MSRRNKGKNSMNQDTDTSNSTDNQESAQATDEQSLVKTDDATPVSESKVEDESTTEQPVSEIPKVEETAVAAETVTEQPESMPEPTPVVEQPEVKSPAPTITKQGTVVSGTTSALGRAVAKEAEKKILSQSSKMLPPTLTAFEQKVEAFVAKGNNEQKNIVNVLKRYIEEMPRGVEIKSETARLQQRALWNTILGIANKDEKFRENWRMLISFFRNYSNDSLGDRSVNRYMDHLTNFKDDEKQAFLNILALISVTVSTPNVKDVQKYIVLDKVLVRPIKADARQRIINYYS